MQIATPAFAVLAVPFVAAAASAQPLQAFPDHVLAHAPGLHVEFRRQGIRVAVPGERGEPRVVRMAFAGAFRGTRPAGAASLGA
ncbi:MAG: hypothetical protein AAF628_24900, partial [Planctomycetota bacterium]